MIDLKGIASAYARRLQKEAISIEEIPTEIKPHVEEIISKEESSEVKQSEHN